ncbi:hypothetical protein PV755_30565 [Streptomyces caniscabiei]|uniref:Uncharacterized protein n=1 Tax=Streptomyces caniscabiei TaxID=2746961 RepID=A0A927L1G7_9ACTN|nr:hypothetical protein [Streptomyces caniscabiei]MBD9724216.1 hypothetical protein [Streptomyces caniscabiei]MDX3513203.1 hypothetical protein [Streptomyces caniscabiei]MDX3718704.1 hypothetical protein [Streptomyces caniscabiei]MDX3727355.1 hypothetical protein [Streptomyces caniscabiei]WEO21902.1 hypothetical protein IHE65_01415 [Streptomyces caniscabiei]
MTQQHSSLAFRWALRLHPAAYRAEHEAELTAIYTEATRDAGPLARLREALDVAGHALRRRTGLGSDRMAGQVLAQATPLAVAVAAGSFVAGLLWLLAPGGRTVPTSSLPNALSLANTGLTPLLWLVALAAVWTGRWTVARALIVAAMVLCLADVLAAAFASSGFYGTPSIAVIRLAVPLLTGAVVLAAPRDLLGPSLPQRRTIMGTAVLAAVLMSGVQLVEMYSPYTLGVLSVIGPLWAGVLWAGVLAIALLFGARDRLTVAGVAVAVLPTTLQVTVQLTPAGGVVLLLVLLSSMVPFLRARRRHSSTPSSAA